ncbi:MAG: hypothetical protein Q9217_004717, partial [Psora testacea]
MLTLDLDPAIRLEYLAEGAANVVYRICTQAFSPSTASDARFESDGFGATTPPPTEIEPTPLPSPFQGKLVRLRKALSSTVPVVESHKHFEDLIAPLFPRANLVEQILFRPTPALLKDCNTKLRQMEAEGARSEKRLGIYLVEYEKYGCLITDMTCDTDSGYESLEFKPKWLTQSPNAPAQARRCRTCALRAMKRFQLGASNHWLPGFCPLNLVSMDISKVEKAISHMLGKDLLRIQSTLAHFLNGNLLLMRLRELQLQLDPDGVLTAELTSPRFLAAMTLRDCTLFLK